MFKETYCTKFKKNKCEHHTDLIIETLQRKDLEVKTFQVDEGTTEDGFQFMTLRFYTKKKEGKMKKKIEIGDVIEIKKEYIAHMEVLKQQERDAWTVMTGGGSMYRKAQANLWEFVLELYPELKGFRMTYKSEDKEHPVILITGKDWRKE